MKPLTFNIHKTLKLKILKRKNLGKQLTFGIFLILLVAFFYHNFSKYLLYIGDKTFNESSSLLYSLSIAEFSYTQESKILNKENKPSPWTYYQLGRIAFIKGDFLLALENFTKELEYYPTHTKVYYMRGLTLGYMGREKEGIESFKVYIKSTNDSWASYNDLAWLQFRIGDIEGALATIEPVAKQQPSNPWIANTYGVLLMNKGRYTEAKESLLRGKETLSNMTEEDWGRAYPGNDPRIYKIGLTSMKESFDANLELINKKLNRTKTTSVEKNN